MNTKIPLALLFSVLLTLCGSALAQEAFTDNFEGDTINPFWTIVDQSGSGSVNLDTTLAHSGTQSVVVTTDSFGGLEDLRHSFPSPLYGTVSVWVYYSNTTETGYKQLDIFNGPGSTGSDYSLYIDWGDLKTYIRDSSGTYHLVAPRQKTGWHQWTFSSLPSEVSVRIGNKTVFTQPVRFPFQTVNLQQCCLGGSAFFDDFSFSPAGNGVDVSYSFCPGDDDPAVWDNMFANGVQFAMSESWNGIPANQQQYPPCPNTQLPAAQAAGLTTGTYAFLSFTKGSPSGDSQIATAIAAICAPSGPPCAAFTKVKVIAIDIEPCCGETAKNMLSVSDRINSIIAAVGAVQGAKKTPIIYTTRGDWSKFTQNCQNGTNAACTNLISTVRLWDSESDMTFPAPDGSLHCGDGNAGLQDFKAYHKGIGGWQVRSGDQFDLGLESGGCSGNPMSLFGGTYGDVDLDNFDPAIFQ